MTYKRLRATSMLLFFGFIFIIQVIGSSFIDFYPRELLVALGFSAGIAMVIGSAYALMMPEGKFWNTPDKTTLDDPTRTIFSTRTVPARLQRSYARAVPA
jgi:hypothetical protein